MKTERTRRSNSSIEEIAPPAGAPLSGVDTQDNGWPMMLPIKKEEQEVILNWFESIQDGEETTDKEVDKLESTNRVVVTVMVMQQGFCCRRSKKMICQLVTNYYAKCVDAQNFS
jgi:hypothetical protein